MSTILKALQRLEEEKSARTERTLDQQIAAPERSGARRGWSWGPLAGALAGGIAVGMLALFGWRFVNVPVGEADASEPDVLANVAAPAPPEARTLALGARTKPREPEVRNAPPVARMPVTEPPAVVPVVEQDVQVIERPRAPAVSRLRGPASSRNPADTEAALDAVHAALVAAGVEPPARAEPEAESDTNPRPGALPAKKKKASARATEPVAAAPVIPEITPKVVAAAEPSQRETPTRDDAIDTSGTSGADVEPSAPARVAPPPTQRIARAVFPNVFVQSTTWHPSSERRTAMVKLDGKQVVQVHEGDAIGTLVVEEIEPTGVYFAHEGVAVRRRVGKK